MSKSRTTEMLTDCENVANIPKERGGPGFNEWEKEFLESLREQFDRNGSLTDKQLEKLEELWDKV